MTFGAYRYILISETRKYITQKGENTMTLTDQKAKALETYKAAKVNYLENMSEENWKRFCEAKRNCMMLGIRI